MLYICVGCYLCLLRCFFEYFQLNNLCIINQVGEVNQYLAVGFLCSEIFTWYQSIADQAEPSAKGLKIFVAGRTAEAAQIRKTAEQHQRDSIDPTRVTQSQRSHAEADVAPER